jgi:hypothetical protein
MPKRKGKGKDVAVSEYAFYDSDDDGATVHAQTVRLTRADGAVWSVLDHSPLKKTRPGRDIAPDTTTSMDSPEYGPANWDAMFDNLGSWAEESTLDAGEASASLSAKRYPVAVSSASYSVPLSYLLTHDPGPSHEGVVWSRLGCRQY